MGQSKRYYEAEFGVWVEEPDPAKAPACGAVWPDSWDHRQGPRPRCFRPEGHSGEHHETRRVTGSEGWVEFYWGADPSTARSELRTPDGDAGGSA